MSDLVVQVCGLTRRFGETKALDELSIEIPRGLVYGLVGANGAGKTTLIKHILGLLRPQTGSVRVFGQDPVSNPVEVLEQIGYLSESRELPEWMRIDELLRYTSAFFPKWDQPYADELVDVFGLAVTKKVRELSKGMRAQVGLIAAVAARPNLLLLDEPSTGLDAVVRRDILNAIIRTVADDGRTVLFSSHLLDEVEQMSDHIFMIDQGSCVLEGSLDDVKAQHHHLVVEFDRKHHELPAIDGVISAVGSDQASSDQKMWKLVSRGDSTHLESSVESLGGTVAKQRGASLEEIFVAHVGRDRLMTADDEL